MDFSSVYNTHEKTIFEAVSAAAPRYPGIADDPGLLALWRGAAQRVYNVNDDTELKMGDYVDLAADLYGLPRPPRIARDEASARMPPMLLSFMQESRRMVNVRLKMELGLQLHYPTVREGLDTRATRVSKPASSSSE